MSTANMPPAGHVEPGLCIETVFTDRPLGERFKRVAEIGFRNVEFWLAERACPDPEELARLADAAGVRVTSLVLSSPDGGVGGGLTDPSRRDELLDRTRACFDYARAAGIGAAIICTGNRIDGADEAAMRRSIVEGLRAAAELAESAGVTLLLEALNDVHDHPGYWLTSSDTGAELCREVGSERLRLLYDAYHMQIVEGDLAVHIERNLDMIGHVHVAGVPGRHEPDVGEINYAFLVEHLRRLGWRGVTALEYKPTVDHEASLRRSLSQLAPNKETSE